MSDRDKCETMLSVNLSVTGKVERWGTTFTGSNRRVRGGSGGDGVKYS